MPKIEPALGYNCWQVSSVPRKHWKKLEERLVECCPQLEIETLMEDCHKSRKILVMGDCQMIVVMVDCQMNRTIVVWVDFRISRKTEAVVVVQRVLKLLGSRGSRSGCD